MTTTPFNPSDFLAILPKNGKHKSPENDAPSASQSNPESFSEIILENKNLKEDMTKKGFEEARAHNAHPSGLEACLLSIFEAFQLSNTEKWKASEQDRLLAQGQIRELTVKNEELSRKEQRLLESIHPQINALVTRIAQLKELIFNSNTEKINVIPPNKLLWNLLWIIFIPLSIALFIFYVNASYRAFFPVSNFSGNVDELEKILKDSGIFDIEIFWLGIDAIYPVFVPFIFLAFGAGLHLLIDDIMFHFNKKSHKVLAILGLILIAFIFDGIIAGRIHHNIHFMKELMGQQAILWYESGDFWLVIFCGFITCLIWSLIFHGIQSIYNASNPDRIREKNLKIYQSELTQAESDKKALEEKLATGIHVLQETISENKLKMVQLEAILLEEKSLTTYNGKLKICLDAFYLGWLQFVNSIMYPASIHEKTFKNFIQEHFIKIG